MRIQAYGDRAVLVQFDQKLDPQINGQVRRLNQAIQALQLPGITYTIPAYCSLTVGYNPEILPFKELIDRLETAPLRPSALTPARRWKIPVCYEPPYALDWAFLEVHCNLPPQEMMHLHGAAVYTVYMLGFLPGFAYLGPVPERLESPRKSRPRRQVPAGSVGLAGRQTGIYPVAAPGGWQIIGRSPIPFFLPEAEVPILFQAGDEVRFEAIAPSTFRELELQFQSIPFDQSAFYE